MSSDLLSPSDAADALGVSLRTLARYAAQGRLPVYRTPGGHRRFRRDDLERLLRR